MAQTGRGGGRRRTPPGSAKGGAKRPAPGKSGQPHRPRPTPAPAPAPEAPRTFRLGAIPGATPGKWIDRWRERLPHVELVYVPLDVASQREAILSGTVDAALIRLPIDKTDLHVIRLYDEESVVVTSADSSLTAAEELDPSDLAGEVLIVPRDHVLDPLDLPGTQPPRFVPPETTADAIATVAAGVGFLVVPLSLARLHHRKDLESIPLRGAPTSTVALAWHADRTTADVDTFVGIVRGRTAHSSR
ncbi:LysR family substrate-binding domain-containing protein [Microbacterium stercoris]|uniref:LysR family substrate-binding domain-containing protein n=1 Tax=Microbacterium stercoris TaxID=2820289 RepID=A0A939QJR5_9MICO|nr:LysR family substrate-binding domain-containing protein [Microbacterium stercoris]MBO3663425.1 LysR family substrate-binding domain-containing protein [Microbacterium stercoris]